MEFETKDIRNVAIAGHSQTGKTTLLEQLLHTGGLLAKPAPVESGKTVSSSSPEEVSRHISIYSCLAHMERGGKLVNLWDTPGASDFTGEVISAFRSSEAALLLVDSRSGAQVETVKLWRDLDRRSKPRMVFLNRVDDARGNVMAAVQDLHDKFNVEICQVTIPMGAGPAYKGVIDVLHGKAYFKGSNGIEGAGEAVPAEYEEAYRSARGVLMGSAAEGDDDLLVKFIDEGELTDEEILSGLKAAFAANKVVPCFSGDPLHSSGLSPLLDFIADVCPSPLESLERAVNADGTETAVKIQADGPLGALVVKTAGDQFSGKLSYIKIISGSLSADSSAFNLNGGKAEKIGKLYRTQGKKLEEIKKASAGDICVVAKLGAATGDSLAADAQALPYKPLRRPEPVYSLAISCAEKKNEMKVNEELAKVSESDRTVTFQFNPETRQNVLSGMGELQLQIILDKIQAATGISVQTSVPRVAYRETVQRKEVAEYTHKKQTGGHGQYAKVQLSVEAQGRGAGFKFTNAVFGGAIPKNYIPGVEKGVRQAMENGVMAGYPVVDISVTVLDGKHHPVDSSDLAFQIAARTALSEAMRKAGPLLLEPVMNLSVWAETKYIGDIMSDLSSRRGRILGQEAIGSGIEEIRAQVPQSELLRYAIDLRSITSSTGSFETSFDHYDPISGKLADKIVEESKAIAKEAKE